MEINSITVILVAIPLLALIVMLLASSAPEQELAFFIILIIGGLVFAFKNFGHSNVESIFYSCSLISGIVLFIISLFLISKTIGYYDKLRKLRIEKKHSGIRAVKLSNGKWLLVSIASGKTVAEID